MGFGFQSFTDSGVIQIDSNVKHLVYKTKGTNSTFTTSTTGVSKTCTVTYVGSTGTAPRLYVLEGQGIVRNATRSGDTFTFTIVTKWATSSVTYYIYDVIPNSSGGNYGFQMFTASGELSFDAYQRPLVYNNGAYLTDEGSLTVTSGQTYATSWDRIFLVGTEGVQIGGPESEVYRYILTTLYAERASPTLMTFYFWKFRGDGTTALGDFTGGDSIGRYRPATVTLADVTGL